jgi:hypothetical protein
VHLVPAAVVRLVRTLAHGISLARRNRCGVPGQIGTCAKFGRHRPPTDHDSHGHAAPVDTGRPANGTRWRETGSNSRRPGRGAAVATCGELLAGAPLRGLGSPEPRFPAITGSPQSEPACDPHHTSGKRASDLRKHRTGRRSDETRKGSFHSL